MTISVGSSALLHFEQPLDHLVFFRAGLARVHLNHFVLVAPLEELIRLDELHQLAGMGRVSSDDQHKRLHDRFAAFPRVGLQHDLRLFVQPHAVFQL